MKQNYRFYTKLKSRRANAILKSSIAIAVLMLGFQNCTKSFNSLAGAEHSHDHNHTSGQMPMPPAPAASFVPSQSLSGEAPIADNFDVSTHILNITWQLPPAVLPNDVSAFRMASLPGQVLADDPIVYPGQPGASHLHQFFGNTGTNAHSTYQSLRTTGGSTFEKINIDGASVNRTSYWVPAMLDGVGNVVRPDWINTYYKQHSNKSAICDEFPDANNIGKCVGLPNGLRFIFGFNMSTNSGGPADLNSRDWEAMGFDCMERVTGNSFTGPMRTIDAIVKSGKCPVGAWLRAYATIPYCWDGKNLDSPDHRAHMIFPRQSTCSTSHPYVIPEVAVSLFYTTDANFAAGKWRLSSDEMMPPGTHAGTTLHMDYWEAWSPTAKKKWEDNCINGGRSCSNFEFGDGTYTPGRQPDGGWPVQPKVPISSIPKTP